ncbi:uncharacterized protein LOC107636684 [Arachis ipaensis]|uniref:uncharacterized protein LOC107636684 n=1 Tax=Arachis ipaensis TaxID=130454 RepID=UPI0007AF904A|nr:uncharacterized protein LOC107636684 [Arachis ipaensis]
MTIAEYTSKFEELCRFSRISQGTFESYECWKCVKYQVGLREDIMCIVAPLEIRRFSELVDKATIVEDYAKEATLERDVRGSTSSRVCGKYVPSRGQNFKGRHAPQRYQGQWHIGKNLGHYHQARGGGKQAWDQQEELRYPRCGRYHPEKSCMAGFNGCYRCGSSGHIYRRCPYKKDQDADRFQ